MVCDSLEHYFDLHSWYHERVWSTIVLLNPYSIRGSEMAGAEKLGWFKYYYIKSYLDKSNVTWPYALPNLT